MHERAMEQKPILAAPMAFSCVPTDIWHSMRAERRRARRAEGQLEGAKRALCPDFAAAAPRREPEDSLSVFRQVIICLQTNKKMLTATLEATDI
ncbi:hypothetical protein [Methylosinus sporium]|uniref:hypothetical protein n=1 Tax=Methylosinus sporium TaxID=428 RepID=UPI00383BE62D